MKKVLKLLLLIEIIFQLSTSVSATHIIGGDITYECISQNLMTRTTTFDITMWVYRDPTSTEVAFDNGFEIGVYRRIGGAWFYDQSLEINLVKEDSIPLESVNPCLFIPPKLGVYKGLYRFQVVLPFGFDYQVVYQRCCRNATINNILDPQRMGAAFYVYISEESVKTCNSSPVFKNFPPVLICAGDDLVFDHSVITNPGDSVSYSFCAPATAGGGGSGGGCAGFTPDVQDCPPPFAVVRYIAPYTVQYPMGGSPLVKINEKTGLISGKPDIQGQYVIGICVTQYRNGIILSIIQRDFQFNVSKCEKVFTAKSKASDIEETKFPVESADAGDTIFVKSCGATKIFFENISINKSNKVPNYKWIFYKENNKQDTFTTINTNYVFPGLGVFYAALVVNPGGGACSDTAKLKITITKATKANFTGVYDSCAYGPMQFFNKSLLGSNQLTVLWDLNGEDVSRIDNPIINWRFTGKKTIRMILTDENQCIDVAEQVISYNPIPNNSDLFIKPIEICAPLEINFKPVSNLLDSTYSIIWKISDGQELKGITPNLKINTYGLYSLKIQITSPNKCYKEVDFNNLINVLQSPKAGFDFNRSEINVFNRKANFNDTSESTEFWAWYFGNSGGSTAQSPTFVFPDTGQYKIIQIVGRSNGCTDTLSEIVDIAPIDTVFVPSAFTPNSDILNDDFKVVSYHQSIKTFEMKIYDRYGGVIFTSDNPLIGWNGLLKNGSIAMSDVYTYDIKYETYRKIKKRQNGYFTLLR